jgi:hypothetical protein
MTAPGAGASGALRHGTITRAILVTFFEVYNEVGSGFLESIYCMALARSLAAQGLLTSSVPAFHLLE